MEVKAKLSVVEYEGKDRWFLLSDENREDCQHVSWDKTSDLPDEDMIIVARAVIACEISGEITIDVDLIDVDIIVSTDIEGIELKNEPLKKVYEKARERVYAKSC